MNGKKDKRKDFNSVLDECLERVIKGEDIPTCLARYPEYADELEPLLRTAKDARTAAVSVSPRPEFRRRAAAEFQRAIRQMPVKQKEPQGIFKLRLAWAAPIAVVMVVMLAGTGTVAAATQSLPDSPLYSVKLATENVQLALTPSPLKKTELYAQFNDRRVEELVKMAEKGLAAEAGKVNTRMEVQMNTMSELTGGRETASDSSFGLMSSQNKDVEPPQATSTPLANVPSPSTAAAGQTQTERKVPVTTPAMASLASPAKTGETVAPTVTPTITVTLTQPPSTTTIKPSASAPVPRAYNRSEADSKNNAKQDKHSKLQQVLTEKQQKNLEKLQKALEKAPESSKPEIQRAIDIILYGYDTSISNLDR